MVHKTKSTDKTEATKAPKGLSRIATEVPLSGIRRFFDLASEMKDVVSLGVGEPDFFTPWNVREAAIYSLERGQTAYTSNAGLIELRRAINAILERLYRVSYNPDNEILVTVGVSQGLDLVARTLLDPGDEVLIPEPAFVAYRPCIYLAGGVPIPVETTAEDNFAISVKRLQALVTDRTKAILMCSPSNPTGAVLSEKNLQEVVDFACEHGLYIISDEIYDRLVYDQKHVCVSSLPGARERTILLNGFSKAYAMTGWRLAYACAPREIISVMKKVHSHTMMCAPTTAQIAAVEALTAGEQSVLDMRDQYNKRRLLIVSGLREMGLDCHTPQGAFYAFPSIRSTGLDSETFAERLLLEGGVAVVPGTVFGVGGEGHIRCSYATNIDTIRKALERMKRFIGNLEGAPTMQKSV